MTKEQTMQLCLNLMNADTEDEVVKLLQRTGLWDDAAMWRDFGDLENNYSVIGNQQASSDAALVEKIVNSIDARLMNECMVRGINPESSSAPQSVLEAVGRFFDEGVDSVRAGRIREWPLIKRTEVARGITVSATGPTAQAGKPSFTISDCGEGQTPEMMPHTLLSLDKSNKLRIPFVQGKFNMGGTGVLNFCGKLNLQLVVTRRNPKILSSPPAHPSDIQWGFTVVRRQDPVGGMRSSVYTYLAPLGSDLQPRKGGVLRFSADALPIFPEGNKPYARESSWGTLIKLYEYLAIGFKTNMLRRDGFLGRADILLPDVALPVRLHECRPYGGHAGSFENTLTGLSVRLDDDKAENLEFSSSSSMSAMGEPMTATIYAFKKGKAETYRKNEGIIFIFDGQTQGHLKRDFFTRNAVRLGYIADSILVIVDCSKFSRRSRELLVMNSRDRLRRSELREEIERTLEDLLKNHEGLRALAERRRREELESSLEDSKPLVETLESLLKRSPTLSALFLRGNRMSIPFKTVKTKADEQPFHGKVYPTYFRFRGKDYGVKLNRECPINTRCRISFDTDAGDDYFSREIDPGQFSLLRLTGEMRVPVSNFVMHVQNGGANLSLDLPDNCREQDVLQFVALVTDSTQIEPFENAFSVTVGKAAQPSGGQPHHPKHYQPGTGPERDVAAGIALPNIREVKQSDWGNYTPPFDQITGLRIVNAGFPDAEENGNGHEVYDFFVNVDNIYLKNELKSTKQDPQIVRYQFIYGLVLFGLAVVQDQAVTEKSKRPIENGDENGGEAPVSVEKRVESVSRALAPFVIPVIQSLGALAPEEIPASDRSGEPA